MGLLPHVHSVPRQCLSFGLDYECYSFLLGWPFASLLSLGSHESHSRYHMPQ